MRKVKIITDSTNDLSAKILQEYDITVVPLYVEFGEETYKDGLELDPGRLIQMVDDKGIMPKTASPSPYDFSEIYWEYINQEFDLVVITLSSELSSTYQNAVLAAAEFPPERILVVDSKSLSSGIGILVMAAGDYARTGMSAELIAEQIQKMTAKVNVRFIIDTLEYLYKGGRCSAVQNLVSSVLKIRPIIGLTDGKMIVKDKVRGDKIKALDKMINDILMKKESIDSDRIIITYSLGSEDEASNLKNYFKTEFPNTTIQTTTAGCVISSHCGPNTIGVIYLDK
ncbi:MAG: fatty acid-binding protein DegV [Gracilibacter sp. BRH_c7a]|nr:MAG: fatty acid-binding protein DegV [Gracilibacter sp. BRH_c7a]